MKNRFTRFVVMAAATAAISLNPCFESAWADNAAKSILTGTVIVVNQASDTVTLVDAATMEAYKHVPVVGGPHEAAVSPDGRRVARDSGGCACWAGAGRRAADGAPREGGASAVRGPPRARWRRWTG